MMAINLVSIDASTKKTGISHFLDGEYTNHYLLDYSKIKDIENRFESMSIGIWNILDKIRPNIIYIEETYMHNNAQTMKILTRLQGVVYAWCINNGCKFNTITPKAWRKLLNFNQSKETKREQAKFQSIEYVKNNYDLNVSDDEADAICISAAICRL